MKNIQIDDEGYPRCSNCGGRSFKEKRSAGGKLTLGFLAPKHSTCVACGTQFRNGRPQPYRGPQGRKYRHAR